MIACAAPAAAAPSAPSFIEQIAHDVLAWERAEGLGRLQHRKMTISTKED